MYFPPFSLEKQAFWVYTPSLFFACCGTRVFRAENTFGVYFFPSLGDDQPFRAGTPGTFQQKIPGYPTKKFRFPAGQLGFRRTYRTFWSPPLHVEDPHPRPQSWKRLKGKNPEGKNFRKLLRRKRSSAKISKISKNTINPVKVISSIFWEIFWNIFREHFFLPRSFQKFLPFAFLPSGSFRQRISGPKSLGLCPVLSALGVLSHHLKCEMKSPHLVDFSWDVESKFGRLLADFRRF